MYFNDYNIIPNTIVATIVIVNPTAASYGISFNLSFISILILPPVVWKKLPCGKLSKTVHDACIIAAVANPDTPSSKIVGPNTELATAAPEVVDAVAAAMNNPETGANAKLGNPKVFIP